MACGKVGNLSREVFNPKGGGTDKYKSMTEMMSKNPPGRYWEIKTKNLYTNTLITAIHGGGIEIGCTELAEESSNLLNVDFFTLLGNKSSNNGELHVTSTNYDEPTLINMTRRSDYTVAIHGASGTDKKVLLGGLDFVNKEKIKNHLTLKGFDAEDAPDNLSGTDTNNITNQNKRHKGVQLELTTALRKSFFTNDDWSKANRTNRDNWTQSLHDFTQAIADAVAEFEI